MSDPRPVADGLAEARAALAAARSAPVERRPSPDPDLDAEGIAELRNASLVERRAAVWRMTCPQRFHRATLDTLPEGVAADVTAWRSLSPRPNLVLLGPVGTGKTHAALAAVREDWMDRGIEVRFLPIVEALDALRPGGPDGAWDDLLDIPRLVLDDLGTERPTDWTAERFGALVNRRWMEERPIVATSNLAAGAGGALCSALGERTYSRLVGSDAVVLHLSGADRRRARG